MNICMRILSATNCKYKMTIIIILFIDFNQIKFRHIIARLVNNILLNNYKNWCNTDSIYIEVLIFLSVMHWKLDILISYLWFTFFHLHPKCIYFFLSFFTFPTESSLVLQLCCLFILTLAHGLQMAMNTKIICGFSCFIVYIPCISFCSPLLVCVIVCFYFLRKPYNFSTLVWLIEKNTQIFPLILSRFTHIATTLVLVSYPLLGVKIIQICI